MQFRHGRVKPDRDGFFWVYPITFAARNAASFAAS